MSSCQHKFEPKFFFINENTKRNSTKMTINTVAFGLENRRTLKACDEGTNDISIIRHEFLDVGHQRSI
jgi:hypothetical protein